MYRFPRWFVLTSKFACRLIVLVNIGATTLTEQTQSCDQRHTSCERHVFFPPSCKEEMANRINHRVPFQDCRWGDPTAISNSSQYHASLTRFYESASIKSTAMHVESMDLAVFYPRPNTHPLSLPSFLLNLWRGLHGVFHWCIYV